MKIDPNISSKDLIKFFVNKMKFTVKKRKKKGGSHVTIITSDGNKFTIPLHKKLKEGTFKAILRQAGISLKKFEEMFK